MPTAVQKDYLCGVLRFPMRTGTDQGGGSCWQEQQVVNTSGNDHGQHRRQDNEYCQLPVPHETLQGALSIKVGSRILVGTSYPYGIATE